MAVLYAASAPCAAAAGRCPGLPLIRDTEVENLLKDYSRPIFGRPASEAQNITMRIVRHDSFNAFVIDGLNVFMHTGTLMQAETPNQVIGVIAHETGHIAGGAHGGAAQPHRPRPDQGAAADGARHRPDGRRCDVGGDTAREVGGAAAA